MRQRSWFPWAMTILVAVGFTACTTSEPGVEATRSKSVPASELTPSTVPSTVPSSVPTTVPSTVPTSTVAPDTAPTSTAPPTTVPPATEPPPFPLDPDKPAQPYDQFLLAAIEDLERFWRETYPRIYGEPYTELQGGVHPVYPGKTGTPGCGAVATTYADIEDNAFYCPDGDFIAYDDHLLFPELHAELGRAVIGVIVAHEWAHAVQERAGIFAAGWSTVRTEQQADCFAGAWTAHVARGESDLLTFTDADVTDGLVGMISVADAPGQSALDPLAHGSAFDRVGAFQDGFLLGAARCAEYPPGAPPILQLPFAESELNDPRRRNPGDAPYDEIFDLVQEDLVRFWTAALANQGTPFTPPALVAFRRADGLPTCPGVRATALLGTVTWCRGTNTVLYDDDETAALYDRIGDFAVGYLVGNAWSDAVQAATGFPRLDRDRALQSDCLTGAWTQDLVPDPRREQPATISAGDLDEVVLTALLIADVPGGPERLGTAFDKIDAFRAGVLGGLDACTDR